MNEKKRETYPPCVHRQNVDGLPMCYAVGCCEVGDMMCECGWCERMCPKRGDKEAAQ